MFLWRIYVDGNNKMYSGLHVKCPIFFPTLTKFGVSGRIFT